MEGRILYFTAEGDYRLADLRAALDRAIAEPEFVAPMLLFGDARLAKVAPRIPELRAIAAYLDSIKAHFFPEWIVVMAGPLRFGLACMLATFVEAYGIQVHVYRETNIEAAHAMAKTLVDRFRT